MNFFYLIIASWVLLSPIIFNGILGISGNFAMSLTSLVLWLIIFIKKKSQIKITEPLNILFGLIIVLILVFSLFSSNIHYSLISFIWWLSCFALFIGLKEISSEWIVLAFSRVFALLGSLFASFSLIDFIGFDLGSGSLTGFLDHYSFYASFLIFPLFLNIYLVIQERLNGWKKLWLINCLIIIVSLIFTSSWSAWFSIMFAMLISYFLFKRKIMTLAGKPFSFISLKPVIVVCIISIFMSVVMFTVLQNKTVFDSKSSNNTRSIEQYDSLMVRLNQSYGAVMASLDSPVSGFGSGMYETVMDNYGYGQAVIKIYQNWMLKILVENGFIIFVLLCILFFFLFKKIAESIKKNNSIPFLQIIWFMALLAIFLHACMERSWSNPYIFLTFFTIAGICYGVNQDSYAKKRGISDKVIGYVIAIILILVSIIALEQLRAGLARIEAQKIFKETKNIEYANRKYLQSISYNSYDHETWYGLWNMYYISGDYIKAKLYIKKAIDLFPLNDHYQKSLEATNSLIDSNKLNI